MKNPMKVMLVVIIILLVASIAFNIVQARKAKKCGCTEELDAVGSEIASE